MPKPAIPHINGQPCHTYKALLQTVCAAYADNVMFEWVENGAVHQKTYKEFFDDVAALGTALWEKGLEKAHIGILGKNSYAWVLCFAAITLGKSTAVPLNIMTSTDILLEQVRHSDTALLIHSDATAHLAAKIPEVPAISMSALPGLLEEGKRLLAAGRRDFINFAPSPDQLSFIMYTSGTTGTAKGVMISHRAHVSQAATIHRVLPLGKKCIITFPLYHIGDIIQGLIGNIAVGNTLVLNAELKHLFSDMQRTRINSFLLVIPEPSL